MGGERTTWTNLDRLGGSLAEGDSKLIGLAIEGSHLDRRRGRGTRQSRSSSRGRW